MVVAQVPSLLRQLRHGRGTGSARTLAEAPSTRLRTTVIWTVLLFALCRQSQVLIERFLASSLPGGAISHLNYAQKVAQMPMALALMLCTVTFPVLARAQAEGQTLKARDRVERDVVVAGCVVLLGAAAVVAGAHPIIQLLFERGAFTSEDTAATASVMRVYSMGLLGHTLVGALARSYFAGGRVTWAPVSAMGLGIVATAGLGVLSVGTFGVYGIAASNAIGICLTATLLLRGMGPRTVPIRIPKVVAELSGLVLAAAVATLLGALCARSLTAPVPALLACGPTVLLTFVLVGWSLRVGPLVSAVSALGPALRKLASRHDR